jgi:hypothetical protein
MLRDFRQNIPFRRVPGAVFVALALFASGCSSGSTVGSPATTATPADASAAPTPSGSTSFKDKVANFFSGATQRDPQPVTNADTPDYDCPFIDIRQGASTLTIPPPPPDGANEAMTLKYQGIFVRAARECRVANGQMTVRVGVQGRIIVGPAGGAGNVDVPLRIAIVTSPQAGSKLVVTKLIRIPVTVGPTDGNVDFTHIEEGLSFPMPSAAALDSYIIYIGFDPAGAAAQEKPKPAPKNKPKPKVNPNAPTG